MLGLLVTHPDHQRRGAGALLVKYGVDVADEMGLVAYLEASTAGKPLYERWGFKEVDRRVFELEKYGGQGTDINTVMIRPKTSST